MMEPGLDTTVWRAQPQPIDKYAFFLDFDGTLVDIAPRPEEVVVDPLLVPMLLRLKRWLGGALAIISGRSIADLDRMLAPLRLDAAGLHGAEWRCGDRYEPPPIGLRALLVSELGRVRRTIAGWDGVVIEDKGSAFAVHFREAPERAGEVRVLVGSAVERLGTAFRLQPGQCVDEVVPVQADKATAVTRFVGCAPYRGKVPIFAGDDLTDESAIALVRALGGVGLKIIGRSDKRAKSELTRFELRRNLEIWSTTGRIVW